MPSFAIRGANGNVDPGPARWAPDLLSRMLHTGRRLYLQHLERNGGLPEPLGVVIEASGDQGRLIFEAPVLLPDEQFLPLDLVRLRPQGRNRQKI